MGNFNDPGVAAALGNTGAPSADFKPKNIVWGCFLPKALELSAAEMATSATFFTKMQALVILPSATRARPFGKFDNPEDKSEATVYETTKYGSKLFVRDGKYIWRFSIVGCGVGWLSSLQTLNQTASQKIIFADSANVVFGTKSTAVTGGMKGFSIENVEFEKWTMNDGSKTTGYYFEITLANPEELNKGNCVFLPLTSDPAESIKGIIAFDLVLGTLTPASKISIKVVERYSRVNLYSLYSALLNDENAWVVTKAGAAVTPASHQLVAAEEAIELTLTTPAGEHVFSLASTSALDTLGIGGPPDNGFESGTLSATFVQP
jgi:hypothetical protein